MVDPEPATEPAHAQPLQQRREPLGGGRELRGRRHGPHLAQQGRHLLHPHQGRPGEILTESRIEDGTRPQLSPRRAVLPDFRGVLQFQQKNLFELLARAEGGASTSRTVV